MSRRRRRRCLEETAAQQSWTGTTRSLRIAWAQWQFLTKRQLPKGERSAGAPQKRGIIKLRRRRRRKSEKDGAAGAVGATKVTSKTTKSQTMPALYRQETKVACAKGILSVRFYAYRARIMLWVDTQISPLPFFRTTSSASVDVVLFFL
eukprot:gene10292-biopygen3284